MCIRVLEARVNDFAIERKAVYRELIESRLLHFKTTLCRGHSPSHSRTSTGGWSAMPQILESLKTISETNRSTSAYSMAKLISSKHSEATTTTVPNSHTFLRVLWCHSDISQNTTLLISSSTLGDKSKEAYSLALRPVKITASQKHDKNAIAQSISSEISLHRFQKTKIVVDLDERPV